MTTAISVEQRSIDQRVNHLGYRLDSVLKGVISTTGPAKPLAHRCTSAASTIGVLGTLPLEILECTLHMLDIRSLLRLSRVSSLGHESVRSLPKHQQLMEHAPHAIATLGRTTLIHIHSINTIHGTLVAEDCVSCGEYGAFLF
jgi:hypothetical protein